MSAQTVSFLKLISTAALAFTLTSSLALAEEKVEHPRKEEVNDRLHNEKARIKEGVKDGSLSKDQAKQLRGQLKGIKAEERADLKANKGHLTKENQAKLNQEEDSVSQQIGGPKSGNPASNSPVPVSSGSAPAPSAPAQ